MAPRNHVCESCIEDPDLQEVVRKHVISEVCDYCGCSDDEPIACELSDVVERIRFVVDQYYTDPADFVIWDGREGGWQGHPVHDAWDLFANIGWEVSNELLMEDIVDAFSDEEFAEEDFWPGPANERLLYSWERFKHVVKHRRRYTFWSVDNDESLGIAEWQPKEMLSSIGDAIRQLPVTITVPEGARFWRVRVHKRGAKLDRTKDFTSPPVNKATFPNRMSPAGVPMFYGADDFHTAALETVDRAKFKRTKVTGVAFENVVPLTILDLASVPDSFGFFSKTKRSVREAVKFLKAFTKDISQPVKKDGRQHTEYVPTQVFTEFVRYEFKGKGDSSFHGIKYRSSKNRKGCYVLFVDQDECLSSRKPRSRPQVLQLVHGSRTSKYFPRRRKPR